MTSPVYHYENNLYSTVSAARAPGASTLQVADPAKFSSIEWPVRLSVLRDDGSPFGTLIAIFRATGIVGSSIEIDGVLEGTVDQAIEVGDIVMAAQTAGDFNDLWAAINAIDLEPLQEEVDSLTTVVAGKADSSDLATLESEVDALSTTVAGKADSTSVVTLSGTQTVTGSKTFTGGLIGDLQGSASIALQAVSLGAVPPTGNGNKLVGVNSSGTLYEEKALVAGAGISVSHSSKTITVSNSGVRSVALTAPAGLSVSGSPVTTTGTIAITTTLSGMIKGTGSGFTTAIEGTDYVTPSALTTALAAKVDDGVVVKLAGAQTVGGAKTFSDDVRAPRIGINKAPTSPIDISTTAGSVVIKVYAGSAGWGHWMGSETIPNYYIGAANDINGFFWRAAYTNDRPCNTFKSAADSPNQVPLASVVRGNQSVDSFQVLNTSGVRLAGFDGTGKIVIGSHSPTAGVDIGNGAGLVVRNSVNADVAGFDAKGGLRLPSLADSAANNSTLYFSTDSGKPSWKDSSGVVSPLF